MTRAAPSSHLRPASAAAIVGRISNADRRSLARRIERVLSACPSRRLPATWDALPAGSRCSSCLCLRCCAELTIGHRGRRCRCRRVRSPLSPRPSAVAASSSRLLAAVAALDAAAAFLHSARAGLSISRCCCALHCTACAACARAIAREIVISHTNHLLLSRNCSCRCCCWCCGRFHSPHSRCCCCACACCCGICSAIAAAVAHVPTAPSAALLTLRPPQPLQPSHLRHHYRFLRAPRSLLASLARWRRLVTINAGVSVKR